LEWLEPGNSGGNQSEITLVSLPQFEPPKARGASRSLILTASKDLSAAPPVKKAVTVEPVCDFEWIRKPMQGRGL
jgi:hypothetical protein